DAGSDHAHRDFVSTRFVESEFADIQLSLRCRSGCSIDLHDFLLIEQAENNWPQSSVRRPPHRVSSTTSHLWISANLFAFNYINECLSLIHRQMLSGATVKVGGVCWLTGNLKD